ncbi:UNVERIFIED_CONTAM: hypothetical protein Slati_1214300 [Sesamum latifolium]|uniref:Uncharacterized protein n=1 Tax=Sesamum latifolium TaxID=2727402 RepID=A0AAW2XEA5_9LAMI
MASTWCRLWEVVIQHLKMHTRSRARNRNGGVGELEGIFEHVSQEEVQQPFGPRSRKDSRRPEEQEEQEQAPLPYAPA